MNIHTTYFCSLFLLAASLLPSVFPNEALAEDLTNKTNVRVIGEPKGVFQTSGGVSLVHAEVTGRNVGTVLAEGIQVKLVLPNGKVIPLSGPSSLAPNKSATYSADMRERITTTEKLKADATCGNCWD